MSAVSTRPATRADAVEATSVLRQSITELCELDHQHDAATLDRWLRNKTPEQFEHWLTDAESRYYVAVIDGAIAGVGALHRSGEIRLCYVRPDLTRQGVGRALLARLEAAAHDWQIETIKLNSSLTARPFYERCGYVSAGESTCAFGVLRCYPFTKTFPAEP